MPNRKKSGSTPVSSNDMEGSVRHVTASDLSVGMAAVEQEHAKAGGPLPWTVDDLRAAMKLPKNMPPDDQGTVVSGLIFHDTAKKCRGYVLFRVLDQWVTITRLVVSPNCRRRGVASALLRELWGARRAKNSQTVMCVMVPDGMADLELFFSEWGISAVFSENNGDAHTFFLS